LPCLPVYERVTFPATLGGSALQLSFYILGNPSIFFRNTSISFRNISLSSSNFLIYTTAFPSVSPLFTSVQDSGIAFLRSWKSVFSSLRYCPSQKIGVCVSAPEHHETRLGKATNTGVVGPELEHWELRFLRRRRRPRVLCIVEQTRVFVIGWPHRWLHEGSVLRRRVLTKTTWRSWHGDAWQSFAEGSVDLCPRWYASRDACHGNKGDRRIGHGLEYAVGLSYGTSGVFPTATCRITSAAGLIEAELARALNAGWKAPAQLLYYLSPPVMLTGD